MLLSEHLILLSTSRCTGTDIHLEGCFWHKPLLLLLKRTTSRPLSFSKSYRCDVYTCPHHHCTLPTSTITVHYPPPPSLYTTHLHHHCTLPTSTITVHYLPPSTITVHYPPPPSLYTTHLHHHCTLPTSTITVHYPPPPSLYTTHLHHHCTLPTSTITVHYPPSPSLYTTHLHHHCTLPTSTITVHYPPPPSLYTTHLHHHCTLPTSTITVHYPPPPSLYTTHLHHHCTLSISPPPSTALPCPQRLPVVATVWLEGVLLLSEVLSHNDLQQADTTVTHALSILSGRGRRSEAHFIKYAQAKLRAK